MDRRAGDGMRDGTRDDARGTMGNARIDRSIDRGRALDRARGEGRCGRFEIRWVRGPETPRAEGEGGVFGALASESDDE